MTVAATAAETVYPLSAANLGPFNSGWVAEDLSQIAVWLDTGAGAVQIGGGLVVITGAAPLTAGINVTLSAGNLVDGGWPAGSSVTLQRVTPKTQPSALGEAVGFDPAVYEGALDHLDRQTQDLATGATRALRGAPGDYPTFLPSAASRATKYLGFDYAGNPVALPPANPAVALVEIPGGYTVAPSGGDDTANLQAAIDLLAIAGGGKLWLAGIYHISGAGLLITSHSTRIVGAAKPFHGAPNIYAPVPGMQGTVLLYTGTGAAVSFGTPTYEGLGECGIDDIGIVASGGAAAAAGACGLLLDNNWKFSSQRLLVQGFAAGVGIKTQGAGNTDQAGASQNYSGLMLFYHPTVAGCQVGWLDQAVSGALGSNVLQIIGGETNGLGTGSASNVGIHLTATSSSANLIGHYSDGHYTAYLIDGADVKMMACLSEFCTQHIKLTATSANCDVMAHNFSEAGGQTLWLDAGTNNAYRGRAVGDLGFSEWGTRTHRPAADASDILVWEDAEGNPLVDLSGTGAKAYNFQLVNGTVLKCFSDAFVTMTLELNSANGQVKAGGLYIDPTGPAAGQANRFNRGAVLAGYSDAAVTQTWNLDSSTGNLILGTGGAAGATGPNWINVYGSDGIVNASSSYWVNNLQVVRSRQTGWGAPSGSVSRAALNTGTATLSDVAQTLGALIADLTTHGLIGP